MPTLTTRTDNLDLARGSLSPTIQRNPCTTTETAVVDKPEEDEHAGHHHGHAH
jgi:hypothetical protein